jgi:hypothetical protein
MSATARKPKPKAEAPTFGGTIDVPPRCKPSRALSKGDMRPILEHAYLRRRDDGMWLLMTDSYIAVGIKVNGDAEEGWVPGPALKHIERGRNAEQLSDTSWRVDTEPYASTVFDISKVVDGAKEFPDLESVGLWDLDVKPTWNGDKPSVGMNPGFMKRIADSFGCGDDTGCRFDIAAPLRPIRVTPLRSDIEAVGLQMPIRLNV